MTRTSRTVALFGCLAAAAGWLALAGSRPGVAGQPRPAPQKAAAAEDRQPDQGAVRKALEGFVAAFRKGDGKAVAACWTAEGEYTSDDGTTFRGRPSIVASVCLVPTARQLRGCRDRCPQPASPFRGYQSPAHW